MESHITVDNAIEILLDVESEYYLNRNSSEPIYISKAYIIRNDVVTPVWVFSEEHDFLNKVMIDALTGEIVHMG